MPRFVFDTSVLITYLRDENSIAADAFAKASDIGTILISVISIMELYRPNRDRRQVEEEVKKIYDLAKRWHIKVIYATPNAQKRAKDIVKRYYSNLGRSATPDALILSVGTILRAYVVTENYRSWSIVYNRVLSPDELVRRF